MLMLIKQRAWKNRPTCPDQTRLNPVNVLSKAKPIVMGSDMLVYFVCLSGQSGRLFYMVDKVDTKT